MKRFLKWLGVAVASVAALSVCAAIWLFVASQRVVARTYDIPPSSFNAPSDRESVRRGERLAAIYGCTECHGHDLTGTDLFDKPGIVHITAPNLTSAVKDYTDAELERLIRHGIKHDGTSAWIMPSSMFRHLSDADLAAIVAYVRSFPEAAGIDRLTDVRPLGRVGIVTGQFTPQAERIADLPHVPAPNAADPLSQGRYLVMTSCTECHGARLEGWDYLKTPNLAIVAAYSDEDFARLMRHGKGLGERDLGLMSEVARARFAHFTDQEIGAIRGYLDAFAQQGATALP
jgi:cytochrome c553